MIAANGDVTLSWEDLSEFGAVEYILEMSPDLTEGSFQPVTELPLTTTSTTLSDLAG